MRGRATKIQNDCVPFLKWPGGKRWFISNHSGLLPTEFERYIEPFLGSGTVFFYLKPAKALLGDINRDLIAAYQGLQQDWIRVERLLEHHEECHDELHYHKVRNSRPKDVCAQAARLIYLNRTCFNGIYRVNFDGGFNVPKGDRNSILLDTDNFDEISCLLQKASIQAADFELLVNQANNNDFIFADPPYTVAHNTNGFIRFNENLFSWKDQVRLAESLARARDRGAKVVSTNANHHSLRALYERYDFTLEVMSRFSSVSANRLGRRQFEELVVLGNCGANL